MAFHDQAVVKKQYATEANLRARQALWVGATGDDPKVVLWRTLERLQPERVLEVGGGQGELAERMQNELGAQVAFVDYSPRMVELAQARGIADAQQGDVQELPFADGAFDVVVAAWMLYHVPDLERAFSEIVRVLEPGGTLVAVTTSEDHIAELRELLAYERELELNFNRENGEELLRRHFATDERFDCDVRASVDDRETLVAYRDSTSVPAGDVPEDVELPFVVHGRTTVFVAAT